MPNKSWKNIERKVADMLEGKRIPSSGSGAIKGDVQHDDFYIECKWGKQIPKKVLKWHEELKRFPVWFFPLSETEIPQTILKWYEKARMQAEDKIPLLIMKPKGMHEEFVFWGIGNAYFFTTLKSFAEQYWKTHKEVEK